MYVRVLGGELDGAMADGETERVPKKEIKECFLFLFFFSILFCIFEDGMWLEVCSERG